MEQHEVSTWHQMTLDEWASIKEDLHKRLEEAAKNFIGIGYRLRQLKDSEMYDGHKDIYDFAAEEYGLSRSTVSRFIAINEKFSEGGYSLELKEGYERMSSSKLSEMLTLSDAECALITAKTTVSDIRKFKEFKADEKEASSLEKLEEVMPAPTSAPAGIDISNLNPFEQAVWHFFEVEDKKEALNELLSLDRAAVNNKVVSEIVNPSGCSTYRHQTIYIFFYGDSDGVKYRSMFNQETTAMPWTEFFDVLLSIYVGIEGPDVWSKCYIVPHEGADPDVIDEDTSNIIEKAADQILETPINTESEGQSADIESQEISAVEGGESSETPISTSQGEISKKTKSELKADLQSHIKMLDIYCNSENYEKVHEVAQMVVKEARELGNYE